MENCRKRESGSCAGCPLLEQITKLIIAGVPYQEVLDYVTRRCPGDNKPNVESPIDGNGNIMRVIIEGIKVK